MRIQFAFILGLLLPLGSQAQLDDNIRSAYDITIRPLAIEALAEDERQVTFDLRLDFCGDKGAASTNCTYEIQAMTLKHFELRSIDAPSFDLSFQIENPSFGYQALAQYNISSAFDQMRSNIGPVATVRWNKLWHDSYYALREGWGEVYRPGKNEFLHVEATGVRGGPSVNVVFLITLTPKKAEPEFKVGDKVIVPGNDWTSEINKLDETSGFVRVEGNGYQAPLLLTPASSSR